MGGVKITDSWGEAVIVWLLCAIFWGFLVTGMIVTKSHNSELFIVPLFFLIIGIICWAIGKRDNKTTKHRKFTKHRNFRNGYARCNNCGREILDSLNVCPFCDSKDILKNSERRKIKKK